jgi:hypothetical protein
MSSSQRRVQGARSWGHHVHGAEQAGCPGCTGIGCEQGGIKLFGPSHVERAVGSQVGPQLPGTRPEVAAGMAAQAQSLAGGQSSQGVLLHKALGHVFGDVAEYGECVSQVTPACPLLAVLGRSPSVQAWRTRSPRHGNAAHLPMLMKRLLMC